MVDCAALGLEVPRDISRDPVRPRPPRPDDGPRRSGRAGDGRGHPRRQTRYLRPEGTERASAASQRPANAPRRRPARGPDVLRAHRRPRRPLRVGGRPGAQRPAVRSACRRAALPVRPSDGARLAGGRHDRPRRGPPADPGRARRPCRRCRRLPPARAAPALVDGEAPRGADELPRHGHVAGVRGGPQPLHRGRPQARPARQPRVRGVAPRARRRRRPLPARPGGDTRGERARRDPGRLRCLRRVALLGVHRSRGGREPGHGGRVPSVAPRALRDGRGAADGVGRREGVARHRRGARPRRAPRDGRRLVPPPRDAAARHRLLPLPARDGSRRDPRLLPDRQGELAAARRHRHLLRLLLRVLRPRPGRWPPRGRARAAQPPRRLPLGAWCLLPRRVRGRRPVPLARPGGERAPPRQALARRDGPGDPAALVRRPRVSQEPRGVDREGPPQRAVRPGGRQRPLVLRLRPVGVLPGPRVRRARPRSASTAGGTTPSCSPTSAVSAGCCSRASRRSGGSRPTPWPSSTPSRTTTRAA